MKQLLRQITGISLESLPSNVGLPCYTKGKILTRYMVQTLRINGYFKVFILRYDNVMILSFRTARSGQTMQAPRGAV